MTSKSIKILSIMKTITLPRMKQPTCYGLLATLLCSVASLSANVWIGTDGAGGNGGWATGTNWTVGAAPNNVTATNQNLTEFYVDETYTTPSATVSLFSTARRANRIHVGLGKTVTFTLGSSLEMASDSLSLFGYSGLGTGTGDSSTTFQATTANATITMGQFYVGSGGPNVLNTLVFDGGVNETHRIVITDNSGDYSRVGSSGGNNELQVINGASLQRHGLDVGAGTAWNDNRAYVRGSHSELNITARLGVGNSAHAGGGDAETLYNTVSRNNYVVVEQGAGVEAATLAIGSAAYARSNYVEVKDAESKLVLSGGRLTVGVASSLGGNTLRVSNGGSVGVFTNVETEIAGYVENSGFNDGRNRLEIESGGVFVTNQDILNSGLIQLASGGNLRAENADGSGASAAITVANSGRFEGEGGGLDTSVFTQVQNGGVFAVGLSSNAIGRSFGLSSTLDFVDGTLELSWLDAATFDQIELLEDAALTGNVILDLYAVDVMIGEEWTLFTGRTDLVSAVFDLSGIESSWDVSRFNEAGGWTLVAVPEPGHVAVVLCLLLLGTLTWRKRG